MYTIYILKYFTIDFSSSYVSFKESMIFSVGLKAYMYLSILVSGVLD
jgi:hypothetical protein